MKEQRLPVISYGLFWTISNGMRAIPNGSELFMWTLQPSSVM